MPQPIVVDRAAQDAEALNLNTKSIGNVQPPSVYIIASGSNMTWEQIGNCFVEYRTNATADGSDDLVGSQFTRPFRLMKVEVVQTSTTAIVAFSAAVQILRYEGGFGLTNKSSGNFPTSYNILQATASATPAGQLVFTFGSGWEMPSSTLLGVRFTGTNTDTVWIRYLVEYI